MVVLSTSGPVGLAEGSEGGIWIISFSPEMNMGV
jgi:hypothetical protein